MIGKSRFPLFISLFVLSFFDITAKETHFPVPEILSSNVEFWKKIYAEVSLTEGLIHDRDYPDIIYAKVKGNSRSQSAVTKRKEITNIVNAITSKPKSEYTEKEIEIFNKFKDKPEALDGAVDRIRFQQGQMDRFKEGLRISGMYLDTIRAILKKHGVPLQLAYLPHVESSFNTQAYSKVGAAGMWQFMRGTGRLYGLKIDYVIDERRDPILATDAAARFLASNYRELKSWPLAITAYNHGVYGMKRAVKQTGSRDLAVIIQNYKSRSFRFASSNFYGCFIAACEIAENYQDYFPNLTLYPSLKYNDLTLTDYIAPDIICKYLNIPKQKLIALNPGIRPTVFETHKMLPKGLVLHIPTEISSQDALLAIGNIPDSLKRSEPPRPQYYHVRRGDNLYQIATRLGVSVKDLAVENNITKLNRIYAGQVLRVPGHAPTQVASAVKSETVSKTEQKRPETTAKKAPEIPDSTTDAVVEIAQAEEKSALPPEESVVIAEEKKKKEPLVSVSSPIKRPDKTPEIGTKPVAEEVISDTLKEIALATAIEEKPTKRKSIRSSHFDVSIYNLDVTLSPVGTSAELRVTVDETIGHYADWLKIPTWRIRKLNQMGRNSNIRINDKLLIPIDQEDALEQFVAARLEYHMALEEDFYTQYIVTDLKEHKIERGQTLWDLCNGSDGTFPLWLLKKHNSQLDLNKLIPGMNVWIPVIGENTSGIPYSSYSSDETTNVRGATYLKPSKISTQQMRRVP